MMTILISIGATLLILFCFIVLISYLLSCKPYTGPRSDHFNGRVFLNPSRRSAKGFKAVGEYVGKRVPDKWPSDLDQSVRENAIPSISRADTQITFVNHSTFFIQFNGQHILTDPIWSKRCSPFQWVGPKRQRPPGVMLEQLPQVDLVLISHNHYDHLDKPTIKKLNKKFNPKYLVPLGLKDLMLKWGCQNVVEVDWWDEVDINGIQFLSTPANHFSSRGTFDRNKTLWCGYILRSKSSKIYFAGDSGYSDIFREIGKREGPIDLSLIPIGAYMPEWFMSPIHISPLEAIQVHLDVMSKKSIAMHFGTFKLADDGPVRSTSVLKEGIKKAGLTSQLFIIPKEGHSYSI